MSTNEQNANEEQAPTPEKDYSIHVTEQERKDFLNRRGWNGASPEKKKELESDWTDGKIRMAIDLNLA